MSIAPYIREIGRGKDSARPLNREQAHDLFSQVLDGTATDLEVGAFCLAMRIKGESVDELMGFVEATRVRCMPLTDAAALAPSGIVVLPSYNGARKLPNLTALLAMGLAKENIGVLVHGPLLEPRRTTTAQVFEALQLPVVHDAHSLQVAWQAKQPAFMDIALLCPPLARLLRVREVVGLRNPGHTVCKLLNPFASAQPASMQVFNHTHPEYAILLAGYAQQTAANALLMRGTEGEPVADARRLHKMDVYLQGQRDAALSNATTPGVLTALPTLPQNHDASSTADYIQSVMAGTGSLPEPIQAQLVCLTQALTRLTAQAALVGSAPV